MHYLVPNSRRPSIELLNVLEPVYEQMYVFPQSILNLNVVVVQFEVAEECFGHAKDLSGFLLLHSALGDAKGLSKLAVTAKEQGKINVAFLSLFLLGKVEDCVQLLIDRYPLLCSSLHCTNAFTLLQSLHASFVAGMVN